jgi:hypothetical protein
MSVVDLTKKIHFNPNIPENHNVYIPSIKDTNAMPTRQILLLMIYMIIKKLFLLVVEKN